MQKRATIVREEDVASVKKNPETGVIESIELKPGAEPIKGAAPGFFNIMEIIQSKEFEKYISRELRALDGKRAAAAREAREAGARLKSHPLDRVNMPPSELASEFNKILLKSSKLPKAMRDVIQYCGEQAVMKWIDEHRIKDDGKEGK